jgi:4a-hydroxytetrahydrobiopterin dehydratase
MKLTEKKCVPCEGGIPPFTEEQIKEHLRQLQLDWEVKDGNKIKRKFEFPGFKEAIEFVNMVAGLAKEEDHHPNIHIYYNKVVIELNTHAIGGLSENDFIVAAKIEEL